MIHKQKDIIIVKDHLTVKILNKKFTKNILDCFHNEPKTASEIAKSISFFVLYLPIPTLIDDSIIFFSSPMADKT